MRRSEQQTTDSTIHHQTTVEEAMDNLWLEKPVPVDVVKVEEWEHTPVNIEGGWADGQEHHFDSDPSFWPEGLVDIFDKIDDLLKSID